MVGPKSALWMQQLSCAGPVKPSRPQTATDLSYIVMRWKNPSYKAIYNTTQTLSSTRKARRKIREKLGMKTTDKINQPMVGVVTVYQIVSSIGIKAIGCDLITQSWSISIHFESGTGAICRHFMTWCRWCFECCLSSILPECHFIAYSYITDYIPCRIEAIDNTLKPHTQWYGRQKGRLLRRQLLWKSKIPSTNAPTTSCRRSSERTAGTIYL